MSMGTASRVYLKVPLGREIPDHSTVNLTRAVYDGSVSVPILILHSTIGPEEPELPLPREALRSRLQHNVRQTQR